MRASAASARNVRGDADTSQKPMPYRILVVDDDPVVTRFAGWALRQAGFEILVAENGKRAMQTIEEHSVDMVITDIVMPEMEGLELITALRKSQPSLPIVAISGAFDGKYLEMAVALGARAALAKPFSAEKLLKTVRQTLNAGPASTEAATPSTETLM